MWSFASERARRRTLWISLAGLACAATAFYQVQNSIKPVGGVISLVKLLWLAGALFLWGILPLLLMSDARIGITLRRGFAALAALMWARGVIEGWMLYVSLNWSPWYGIGHDIACIAVLSAFALRAAPATRLDRLARVHAGVSAAFFLPEIYFAWYMQANFTTTGEGAIYFVPDDPRYTVVLRATTAAVLCLLLYLPVFLYRWIDAPRPERR